MLTEKSVISQIMVLEDGQVNVQRADIILRDGVEIARSFDRHPVLPGRDLSREDSRVQDVCRVVHTPIVVAAFQAANAERDFREQERYHTAIANRFRELSAEDQANPENIALLDASRERLSASSSALAKSQQLLDALA